MKIVVLVSSLGMGGAERVATTLSNEWAKRGVKVTLVPTFSGGGQSSYELDNAVELIPLAQLAGIPSDGGKRYFRRLSELRRLILVRQPNVVLSFLPNVNIAALLATAFTGVPCVICERSDPTKQFIGTFWTLACKTLYRMADGVVVQTESVARSMGRIFGGLRRVMVAPNPIPEALVSWQADLKRAATRRVLLSMGRLAEEKQIDHIISVFAQLQSDHAEWDLHIYGDGPLAAQLHRQAQQAGIAERIFFKGNTAEPWAVMAQADAFVMTSAYEGFPNALLEAMAVGLPCVAYDCKSGPRELSRDGQDALLVTQNRQDYLLDVLHRVMADGTLRQALGAQARQSVMARYSLDSVLEIWNDVLASVRVKR